MNENLIPECREFTMVEELWPIKKYEGNRPVWDCREWLIEAIQGEILDHVRRYNHPYVLVLSEEPIWTQVEYENRRDKMYTLDMQKLSPLEICLIVTPFLKKWYNVYQDEKSKCIKISRKRIPGLKLLELPYDLIPKEGKRDAIVELRKKEEEGAVNYMTKFLRYMGITVIKAKRESTSIKLVIYITRDTLPIEVEIKGIEASNKIQYAYQAIVEIDDKTKTAIGYTINMLETNACCTAHEAAGWAARVLLNIKDALIANDEKNRNNNNR